MAKVTHVSYDDWAGIYIDDELIYQGHGIYTIEWLDVIERLGHEGAQVEAEPAWLEARGNLPNTLDEVRSVSR